MREERMAGDIYTILHGDNPRTQLNAIKRTLKKINGWVVFEDIMKRGGREEVRKRLKMFREIAEEDESIDQEEKKSAKRISDIALNYLNHRKFQELSYLLFNIVIDHLKEFVGFQNSEEWTISELYQVMPDEVFLPFFLLESLTREDGYNWNRGGKIIENGLILLMTSFQLFYEGLDSFEESGKELPYREVL